MIFAREKRLMLGWAALLAPLPLPLNDVLEWPVLFVYAVLVVHFIRRVEAGRERWLPNWALNLLGLAYMPVLAIDLSSTFQIGQLVRSLLHLILFVVLAKLYSMRREKDKWLIFVSLFVIFVAAMATSSHLTIVFYLLAGLALGFSIMARFAHLHVLARLDEDPRQLVRQPSRLPKARFLSAAAMAALVIVAIPIFASLPRINQPFVMAPGTGNFGLSRTTGFSDSVNLSITSEIRGNRAVALRLETEASIDVDNLRLKAATYDFYANNSWHRHRGVDLWFLQPDEGGLLRLPGGQEEGEKATIFLEPLNSTSLPAPMRTVAVHMGELVSNLRLDAGGALMLPGRKPTRMISYDLMLGSEPLIAGRLEGPEAMQLGATDPRGVTPRLAELAAQVMGEGDDETRIGNLLRHLLNEYGYTLDFTGRSGESPIEDFLFVHRSGHCELFATSMVLMLRSQGIPARLVTGFLGAEANALEGYYLVRQGNAHAWVEAWTEAAGWRMYDPTPAEGRPGGAGGSGWRLFFQQLYDYLVFRWDRYVLSYGAEDQRSFFAVVRERLTEWWSGLRDLLGRDDPQPQPIPETASAADQPIEFLVEDPERAEALWQKPWARYGGLALFLGALGALGLHWRTRPLRPEVAYDRLRVALADLGLEIDPATSGPLAVRSLIARQHPDAAPAASAIIDLYVRSSFAERPASAEQCRPLRRHLDDALGAVTRDLKARRASAGRNDSLDAAA
ncbi:MAG: DUF3488 and transglutaminase-like domain-containing protein [Acidobacteriota bacterium]